MVSRVHPVGVEPTLRPSKETGFPRSAYGLTCDEPSGDAQSEPDFGTYLARAPRPLTAGSPRPVPPSGTKLHGGCATSHAFEVCVRHFTPDHRACFSSPSTPTGARQTPAARGKRHQDCHRDARHGRKCVLSAPGAAAPASGERYSADYR